jgi:hypothetical protein
VIRDATVLAEIRRNWKGVETLRSRLQVSAAASGAHGRFPFALADAAHNLPFIHAYGVLNDVLEQLSDEGHFRRKTFFLGELLRNSRKVLPWRDFALVSAGAKRRTAVAHKGQLLDRGECWKYVEAVEGELRAWGVL